MFVRFVDVAEGATMELSTYTTSKTEQQLLQDDRDDSFDDAQDQNEIEEEFAEDFLKTKASSLLMNISKALGDLKAIVFGVEDVFQYAEKKRPLIRRVGNVKRFSGISIFDLGENK
jgi:hypothetical protein